MSEEISTNTEIFKHWKDGYFEGDPLRPLHRSTYRQYGFMSVLHAAYLRCIKPYMQPSTVALELGPDRGAWTRGMLGASEIWVLDTVSAEHDCFFDYLGHPDDVHYVQAHDFSCNELPANHFDYLFSFGCLCHVSFSGLTAYAENLLGKLRPGADCCWMVADFDQYNHLVENEARFNVIEPLLPDPEKNPSLHRKLRKIHCGKPPARRPPNDGETPAPGTWYNAGKERTCEMLRRVAYEVIDPDVGTSMRAPVIFFRKT